MSMAPDGTLPHSPLRALHKQGCVAFGEVDGWDMPRVFENIKKEYLAVKGTVGVMDRSNHGRLRVGGAKRLDLLHRLTTNDLKGIEPGGGARTILLTDKGRIIDDLRLHAREDLFYLLTSPCNQGRVKEIIEKLRFRDDVTVEDVTATTGMISLLGPQAAHLLEAAARVHDLADLPVHHCVELRVGDAPVVAARTADAGGAGFNLIMEAGQAAAVWRALFAAGGPFGISPCGEEAYEMVRIEAGLGRFGRELTEEFNPLEARLDEAISWTKGCYIGQEVVARLESRQKVTKLLAGLWLEPGPVPAAGSRIVAPGQEAAIGRLTSVTPSLDLRRVIGLGYLGTEHVAPGTPVEILDEDDDRIAAQVGDLPFRRPPDGGRS